MMVSLSLSLSGRLSMLSLVVLFASLCVLVFSPAVFGYPEGADPSACDNGQVPSGHGAAISALPPNTLIEAAEYSACSSPLLLTIKTEKAFKGYLASITKEGDGSFTRYGALSSVQSGQSKAICIAGSNSGATHTNNSPKNNFQLQWTVPDPAPRQSIVASITIVESFAVWYKVLATIKHSATVVVPQLPRTLFIANATVDPVLDSAIVTLEWISAGFCHGNAAISSFEIEQDEQVDNNQWNNTWRAVKTLPLDAAKSGSTFKNVPIDELEGGKFYRFRLSAKSEIGSGYSNIVTIKTALNSDTTPSVPTLSIVSVDD